MFETLFMAPVTLISCKCGELFAAYENGHVVKLRDSFQSEYKGSSGVWLGPVLEHYNEDPECSECFGELEFAPI